MAPAFVIEQIATRPNITVRTGTEVVGASGAGQLEQLTLYDWATGHTEPVSASALFILIGSEPHTDWLPTDLARDAAGFLLTGPELLRDSQPPTDWPLTRCSLPMKTNTPACSPPATSSGSMRAS